MPVRNLIPAWLTAILLSACGSPPAEPVPVQAPAHPNLAFRFPDDKARIVWTGTAKAETKGRIAESASWRSTVRFDCKAGRTDSVETEFTIEFEDGVVVRYKTSAAFSYP